MERDSTVYMSILPYSMYIYIFVFSIIDFCIFLVFDSAGIDDTIKIDFCHFTSPNSKVALFISSLVNNVWSGCCMCRLMVHIFSIYFYALELNLCISIE